MASVNFNSVQKNMITTILISILGGIVMVGDLVALIWPPDSTPEQPHRRAMLIKLLSLFVVSLLIYNGISESRKSDLFQKVLDQVSASTTQARASADDTRDKVKDLAQSLDRALIQFSNIPAAMRKEMESISRTLKDLSGATTDRNTPAVDVDHSTNSTNSQNLPSPTPVTHQKQGSDSIESKPTANASQASAPVSTTMPSAVAAAPDATPKPPVKALPATVNGDLSIAINKPRYSGWLRLNSLFRNTMEYETKSDTLKKGERIFVDQGFETSGRSYRYIHVWYLRKGEFLDGWICSGRQPKPWTTIKPDDESAMNRLIGLR